MKAPGRANTTTRLPFMRSSLVTSFHVKGFSPPMDASRTRHLKVTWCRKATRDAPPCQHALRGKVQACTWHTRRAVSSGRPRCRTSAVQYSTAWAWAWTESLHHCCYARWGRLLLPSAAFCYGLELGFVDTLSFLLEGDQRTRGNAF